MKNIVVFSGAGISKESGISTFRDADGLWEKHRIEDVANFDCWKKNPDLVRNFYNQRLKNLLSVEPNMAHKDLVRLEEFFNVDIITQNVDDLHQRAGSSRVIHLHGELKKARSVRNPSYIVDIKKGFLSKDDKDPYGEPLRPHIVWFGEAVPMMENAISITQKADIFIVIGSSLVVYPAAGLIHYTKKDCKKFLVDPLNVDVRGQNIEVIQEKATIGVRKVVDEILLNYK
ncbi:MAG: NAD-dependent deacylase [Bacteroidales bacterium]|jgi:NAD-dependent deacetylase|nr:NAD-dependent deacylase [Bacteroidales bacterium]